MAQSKEEKAAYHKAWYAANRKRTIEQREVYRALNREKIAEQQKMKYEKNRGKVREQQKYYYEKNRERLLEQQKSYRAANQEHLAALDRKNRYGLSEFDYNRLCDEQGFACKICRGVDMDKKWNSKFPGKAETLNIDHCHRTGKVRKLLCRECNTGLGKFKDNIGLLQSAVQHLLDNQYRANIERPSNLDTI
jgi:hypothetical protein